MGSMCLSDLSAQYSQSTERERSAASTQFLRGVSPSVAAGSNSPGGQHEGSVNFLQATQLERTFLVLLCYFW